MLEAVGREKAIHLDRVLSPVLMERKRFERLVEDALAGLPDKFQTKLSNIAVIVESRPPRSRQRKENPHGRGLLLGIFQGVPLTQKSVFSATPPDRIVLYQENIEAICRSDEEIKEQVRLTVLHEIGHYFGLDEEQLRDI